MVREFRRRSVLGGIGAAVTVTALAGCTTDTQNGDGGDGGNGTDGGDGGTGTVPSAVSDYLSDANLYEGSAADETGSDEVTVSVGAGDGFAFDPPLIRISSGTNVVWEWTGTGGGHNVVHEGEEFTSGDDFVSEEGYTYEYTFEETGSYRYYCMPHKPQGMKGAVIVE